MKAFFIVCILLVSILLVPTVIQGRDLAERNTKAVPRTPKNLIPGKPICSKGGKYANCIPQKPTPRRKCSPYERCQIGSPSPSP